MNLPTTKVAGPNPVNMQRSPEACDNEFFTGLESIPKEVWQAEQIAAARRHGVPEPIPCGNPHCGGEELAEWGVTERDPSIGHMKAWRGWTCPHCGWEQEVERRQD